MYEDGEYKYVRSFEDIPDYSINSDEKIIEGTFTSGCTESVYVKYKYSEGKFNKIEETRETRE